MKKEFKFKVICYHSWFSSPVEFPSLASVLEENQFLPRKSDYLLIEWGTEAYTKGEKIKIIQSFVRVKRVGIDLFNKTIEILIDPKTKIEYA